MTHRNSQQPGNPNAQNRGGNRQQMGGPEYGDRGQQSAFQDNPSQYSGHYGAESNYSGARQQGGFDPRADARGYEGNYGSSSGLGNANPYGGSSYETNARGDEYYDTRSHMREPWQGDNRARGGLQGSQDDAYRGRQGGFGRGSNRYGTAGDDYQDLNAKRSHHDPDYQQWREEQIRGLDDDYKAWRDERYSTFSNEFGEWRKNRKNRSSSGAASAGGADAEADGAHHGSSATSKSK